MGPVDARIFPRLIYLMQLVAGSWKEKLARCGGA